MVSRFRSSLRVGSAQTTSSASESIEFKCRDDDEYAAARDSVALSLASLDDDNDDANAEADDDDDAEDEEEAARDTLAN